eukprot:Phypoly_transcript_02219.p1 GENE.Phypoly_transcript_02219~~Phypoly_transcript_02219.p1  ORF type:complete len:905 (+),score=113.90 Phypoly_transcript_02219:198-2912(+)
MQANDIVHQGNLWTVIKQLFPATEISTNSRRVSSIKNPETGNYLELDIYLPEHQLSFEFQDLYHYVTSWYSQVPLEEIQSRDEMKNEMVLQKNYTLITVPYWWDATVQSIAATVLFQRPDLVMDFEVTGPLTPIPLNPHLSLLPSLGVPGIGELMLASFPSNKLFSSSLSFCNPWWIGEKYDGVRCCWHPHLHVAYTRYGTLLEPLSQYRDLFPKIFTDAEIWFGRGMFSLAQKYIVSSSTLFHCFMRIIAFDIPPSMAPFEKRYQLLALVIPVNHPFMVMAFRFFCAHQKQLVFFIKNIISNGGEGLILNKPNSFYEHGKAQSLIKLKASRGDKEGIVLEVDRVKGVVLKLADGKVIMVQPQNVKISVQKGDIVTFSYDSYSQRSVPVNPFIFRIRTDLSWEQVIMSHLTELPQAQMLNKHSGGEVFTSKPLRYWTAKNGKNMREFLVEVAKNGSLDALVPETWYNFPSKAIEEIKGGRTVLQYFGGYVNTLLRVFPDIGLDTTKFRAYALGKHWDVKKMRRWFSALAENRGLDPLVPDSWYGFAGEKISDPKTQAILRHYSGSLKNTLLNLFPEIGLEEEKFPWRTIRSFLEEFARRRNMEPLIPNTWYSISRKDFEEDQIGRSILNRFKGGYAQLVQRVFPEIPFAPGNTSVEYSGSMRNLQAPAEVPTKFNKHCKAGDMVLSFHNNSIIEALQDLFSPTPSTIWKTMRANRVFLERFAKENHFDPLNATEWCKNLPLLALSEHGKEILGHFHNNVENMLVRIFPDFKQHPKSDHCEVTSQKKLFFINFAKRNGFDPLIADNWYSFPFEKINQEKGAGKVLYYYNNNVVKALINVFPNIGLQHDKFCYMPLKYWQDKSNRKKYLETFAAENGLDPCTTVEWKDITTVCCKVCICKSIKGNL